MNSLVNIDGFKISFHEKSKRIIKIIITNETIDKLIFPFNKFNVNNLEYKPFTRFTIAKYLDNLTNNEISKYLNDIANRKQKKFSRKKYSHIFSHYKKVFEKLN